MTETRFKPVEKQLAHIKKGAAEIIPEDQLRADLERSRKAGTPLRKSAEQKLRDLIAGTKNYDGVTGTITLDQNRNASKPAVIIAIEGGKKNFNSTFTP